MLPLPSLICQDRDPATLCSSVHRNWDSTLPLTSSTCGDQGMGACATSSQPYIWGLGSRTRTTSAGLHALGSDSAPPWAPDLLCRAHHVGGFPQTCGPDDKVPGARSACGVGVSTSVLACALCSSNSKLNTCILPLNKPDNYCSLASACHRIWQMHSTVTAVPPLNAPSLFYLTVPQDSRTPFLPPPDISFPYFDFLLHTLDLSIIIQLLKKNCPFILFLLFGWFLCLSLSTTPCSLALL